MKPSLESVLADLGRVALTLLQRVTDADLEVRVAALDLRTCDQHPGNVMAAAAALTAAKARLTEARECHAIVSAHYRCLCDEVTL